jgi:hypothetical protein
MRELPRRDPIRAHQRRQAAARRVGENARCACGETRPEALIAGSKPMICAECQRKSEGKDITDDHHPAGKANSPITIPVPANDHRAELSTVQYDWPDETLENPDGSPILKGAACIRGSTDVIFYIIKEFLLWVADMLEVLDSFMVATHGQNWWRGTELEKFAPKRSTNAKR